MNKDILYNKKDRKILKKELAAESFNRITCSFYRYVAIENPSLSRDTLYKEWNQLQIFGRVYISHEGINAQVSCPEHKWNSFIKSINSYDAFKDIPVKRAVRDGRSFYKLVIKVKKEIVAYKISDEDYDMGSIGSHLNAQEFNDRLEKENAIAVDMRNYYESEVGKFEEAIIPDVDTSRELLPAVKKMLNGRESDPILLYCTGGIRCEKASSYLIKKGFKNVSQLNGGIIQYAHEVQEKGIRSKFRGKNFVFDERMGESITDDVIGKCHQCNAPADSHIDCGNDACHILFIQCKKCNTTYDGCCSKECKEFASLPIEEQRVLRKDPQKVVSKSRYSSKIKPKLRELRN